MYTENKNKLKWLYLYICTHTYICFCVTIVISRKVAVDLRGVKEGLIRGKEDKKWCNTLSILEYFKAGNTHSFLYGTIREKLRSNLATLKVRELSNK